MVLSRLKSWEMLSFWVLFAVAASGCDPNAKVVRAPQPNPEASLKPGTAARGGEDGKAGGGLKPSGESGETGEKEEGKEVKGPIPDVTPTSAPATVPEVTPADASTGSAAPPPLPLPQGQPRAPVGGAPRARPPVPARSQATGNCETGDWGACFRQARSFIVSDPKKAIQFYLKACLPGEATGDGLACNAAAMLSEVTGNRAGASQYYQAACRKLEYPVLAACKRASASQK